MDASQPDSRGLPQFYEGINYGLPLCFDGIFTEDLRAITIIPSLTRTTADENAK